MQSSSQSFDDELLDSSINDIYESIEGVSAIDYQSLVAEDEKVSNEEESRSTNQQLIFTASNTFVEDCLNETTQEISHEQTIKNQLNASNVSSENYICKVVPTEFDLSVDNALQSKSAVVLPEVIEDTTVPKAVYISSKPALIAAELASHETSVVQILNDNLEKIEPANSIPTLIISKSCGDTPPPVLTTDDYVSLRPKKVLKAQDSLELPKEERDKFEPAKRVDSFELDEVDKNADAKISKLENVINSDAEYEKSNPGGSLNGTIDLDKDSEIDENFVIITEEEVEALKVEEQESLSKSQDETVIRDSQPQSNDSLAVTKSEVLLPDLKKVSDDKQVTTSTPKMERFSSSQSIELDEIVDAMKSQSFTSVLDLSSQRESNTSSVKDVRKTFELPAIPELTTSKTPDTNTSTLFTTNQTITLNTATNIMQSNEHGPLPGAY